MPESAMWTLIISLAMLSFGLFLKRIELRKRLKGINKKLQDENRDFENTKKKQENTIIELKNSITKLEQEKQARLSHDFTKPLNLTKNPL
jgi:uncharacterized protein YlxW (UPF0749 family)